MSIIQEFQQSTKQIRKVTFDNITFPNGFMAFMESLVRNDLISDQYKSKYIDEKYQWDNQLNNNGLLIETVNNPLLTQGAAESLIVTGSKPNIELFEVILQESTAIYETKEQPKKVEIKLEYHENLNPKVWRNNKTIRPTILKALNDIAQEFYEFLDMPDLELEDILITGSSANYNWTSTSDIDLHLLVDVKQCEKIYGKLVAQYFDAQRKVWADLHDLSIMGIPVELYVQDTTESHYSTGTFSLMNNEWIEHPTQEKPDIDKEYIKQKSAKLMKEIDYLISHCKTPDKFDKLIDKITKMRKAGLEKGGEFSDDNLVFKALRKADYIDKLHDFRNNKIDKQLSVTESFEKDDPWEDLGYNRPSRPRSPVTTPSPTTTASPVKINSKPTRIWLNVPYAQRDSAKKFGAKFDFGLRRWYMDIPSSELTETLKKLPSAWL
jgi:hypothetical protein